MGKPFLGQDMLYIFYMSSGKLSGDWTRASDEFWKGNFSYMLEHICQV